MNQDELTNADQQDAVSSSDVLKAVATAAAGAGIAAKMASAASPEPASAPVATLPHTIVQLFIRGGADGLTWLAPWDDSVYKDATVRPNLRLLPPLPPPLPPNPFERKEAIALTPPTTLPGGSVVPALGLAPALFKLKRLFTENKICFVHACGSLDETRSHFAQQAYMERGETSATSSPDGNGWIGRYLEATKANPPGGGSLRALAFGTVKTTTYNGGNGVTPSPDPELFDYPTGPGGPTDPTLIQDLEYIYSAAQSSLVQDSLANDKGAISKLGGVDWTNLGANLYPPSVLGRQFRQAYQVIRDIDGVEVISIDFDNIDGKRWDTHNQQGVFYQPLGSPEPTTMYDLMKDLADSLSAFQRDVDSLTDREVVVLVCTEFGRTTQENDGLGTDHGRGGVAMVMGREVTTGKVHVTSWPGLDAPAGEPVGSVDLAVTTDLRHVQAELIQKCFGVAPSTVFPDPTFVYSDKGLITVV